MGQLMRQHRLLLLRIHPVQQVHRLRLVVVEAGDLLRQQAQQKRPQVEVPAQQPKLLQHNLRPLQPLRALILVEVLDQVASSPRPAPARASLLSPVPARVSLADKSPSPCRPSPTASSSASGVISLSAWTVVMPPSCTHGRRWRCNRRLLRIPLAQRSPEQRQPEPHRHLQAAHTPAIPPPAVPIPSFKSNLRQRPIIKCTQSFFRPGACPHSSLQPEPHSAAAPPLPDLAALLTSAAFAPLDSNSDGSASPAPTASAG